jgi:ZIP family zinc transporter
LTAKCSFEHRKEVIAVTGAALVMAIAGAACAATLAGGALALRFRDRLHLLLGFSAGAVIAVALFDLLPEALELSKTEFSPSTVLGFTGFGFFAYAVLDRMVMLHTHTDDEHDAVHVHGNVTRGWLGAGSLSGHSLLDGLAIGMAFKVSIATGGVVAVAVLAHDCSDGMNTVNLVLKNGGSRRQALAWLLTDALAPVLGAAASLSFTLGSDMLSLVLAVFAGFFLFIGASDLLPESHHAHPKFLTTAITVLGAVFIYVITRAAG